jgi:putative spermidine/putrescine transport system substrate-binding protein
MRFPVTASHAEPTPPGRRQATGLLLGGLALPGLLRPARAAQTVTVAGFGGWFQAGFEQAVIAPFKKANPALGVFFYPFDTSLQALGLLRGQRLLPSIDIALMDIAAAQRATAEKLLEPVTPETMPVLRDLVPTALPEGIDAPIMAWDTLAIGYSRDMVKTPPASWQGLWNGAYSQIAIQTPPDTAGLAFTQAASTAFGGHGDLQSLNVGLNALMALAPRVSVWNPRPDVATAVAYGDAAIGPLWNGAGQAQAAKMPTRFGVVLPTEGSPALPITIGLVKGAPQAAGARALMSWALGRDAQTAVAEVMALAPANPNATPSQAARIRAGATAEATARRMTIDWPVMMQIREQLAAEWRRRNLANR